jgi:hypothetical protein
LRKIIAGGPADGALCPIRFSSNLRVSPWELLVPGDTILADIFPFLFLIFVPLLLGLASSTAIRAALWTALAFLLQIMIAFHEEIFLQRTAGAPLTYDRFLHVTRLLIGSPIIGGVLALLVYAAKRFVRTLWRLLRSTRRAA